MAILNYTTKIPASRTMGEIQELLRRHGASKIIFDYIDVDGQEENVITFNLPGPAGAPIYFTLKANWQGVLDKLIYSSVPQRLCTPEHALNVAWRIQKDWLEAQIAIVESGLQTMDEAFFSKAITAKGTTIYQAALNATEGPLLLSDKL